MNTAIEKGLMDEGEWDEDFGTVPPSTVVSPGASVKIDRRYIVLIAAIGIMEAVVLGSTILLVRAAIDQLAVDFGLSKTLYTLIGALAAVALFGAGVRWLEFSVSESIGYQYVERLRIVMYSHLQRLPLRQLLNTSRGALLLRFTGDLSNLRTWISRGIARGIIASITVVSGMAVLAVLDPTMALVSIGILGVGAGLSLAVGLKVRRAVRMVRRQRSNLTTNVTEQIHSMTTIQVFGRSGGEYYRLARQNGRLTDRLLRYAWLRGCLRGISTASGALAVLAVLAVGVLDFQAGRITIGAVVAGVVVTRLMVRPVRVLGLSHDYWQSARVSREKILSFLRLPSRVADSDALGNLKVTGGRIEFHDVSLKGSLTGIAATVEPRQIVALMGPNGAGKSSLLSLVARIADPDLGEILIDDQDITKCALKSTAKQISFMGHELPLTRGSLRRNLTYRWREAPDAEINRVIDLLRLRELVDGLPFGLDTDIKEGGANLSDGLASRIRIGRALIGNPKILLIDESTGDLDAAAQRVFREILLNYGGTVLIATHDPEVAAIADVVWQMEDGQIIEKVPGSKFRQAIATPVRIPEWARAGELKW